jgi:16S rRNA pseudouridine516 synthase
MTAPIRRPRLSLQELLFTQGFGTRRVCAGLIQQGHVALPSSEGWQTCDDPWLEVMPDEGWPFRVQGTDWVYHQKAYLVLHKPVGTECSQRPSTWPSIYSLLPMPLRQRPNKAAVQGVQAVGRLDQDTTGLLILTDDGAMIHRMTSPRHHVPKVYEVGTAEPMNADVVTQLLQGVVLHDDPRPVRAAACEQVAPQHLRLTLTEGKYHQVKRMLAATGHEVVQLHRSSIGQLPLPADLAPGQWRWLTSDELAAAQTPWDR